MTDLFLLIREILTIVWVGAVVVTSILFGISNPLIQIIVIGVLCIILSGLVVAMLFTTGKYLIPVVHKHVWEYERHNSLIIRACDCGVTEEGTIIEEPELVSTARTDISKVTNWKAI